MQSQGTSIKELDMQIGEIANILNPRQLVTLPSDIERNPRGHVKVVTLRSRKELSDPVTKMKNNEEKKVMEEDEMIPGRINFLNNPPSYVPPVPYP